MTHYLIDKNADGQPRLAGTTPTPSDQHEGQQMVPKMEGSPQEQIKMEHQVPQSQNTSLGSAGHESLSGCLPVAPSSVTVPSSVAPTGQPIDTPIQSNPAAVMTSLSSATAQPGAYPPSAGHYGGYGGQTDFYNNQLGTLPGLTHLQTEIEKKKRDSPQSYQTSNSASLPANFGGMSGQSFNIIFLHGIYYFYTEYCYFLHFHRAQHFEHFCRKKGNGGNESKFSKFLTLRFSSQL